MPDRVKVFGVGWAKTGTTTLGKCFRILGYNHQSQDLSLYDAPTGRIIAAADRKESFEDWPWILHYEVLDKAFPGSKFILTMRNTDRWLASYKNMLQTQSSPGLDKIRTVLYGLPFPNVTDIQLTGRYMRHNVDVLAYFRDRPEQLLVVDWEKGDGWEELCSFLGRDIPSASFPHENQGVYED